MSEAITYVITYENGRWVSRCPAGEVEGVGVAGSLSQLERYKVLTSHWSEPDTARVMGLSKQRVHQLKVSA